MSDLPPSAFLRSAPSDPRRRRGPVYATLGLVLAVGASGMIGYSAGYAADDTEVVAPLTVRPVVACHAVPPEPDPAAVPQGAAVTVPQNRAAEPTARTVAKVEARAHRKRAHLRTAARPARRVVTRAAVIPAAARTATSAAAKAAARARTQARAQARAQAQAQARARAAARRVARPARSPLEALMEQVQKVRNDLYTQVLDRITGRSRP
ncbi:hypothetical protein ACIBIZ_16730 [Nonomuraea spiralis]|uniref:hypothetical protein n=1 Tax=Nonomuraea spiralis TaxID=46182 RepID=UPI0037BCCA42